MYRVHVTAADETKVTEFDDYGEALFAVKLLSARLVMELEERSKTGIMHELSAELTEYLPTQVRLTDNIDVASGKPCNDMMKCKTFHYITDRHPGLWLPE